ncbi:a-pheromone receptor PreA [Talaromyces proteolyticus]|uniref:A-pheromone receptor PreA n=1 Tax=Talaromyces proteolyticus TaxID=1131652 RepID=A0AAD4Q474_9EURO|nr:a-pheromone receptor PreA [Talaromyces proteolyticus]KAH8702397.1 a-pheromone receptor PreA [Talaromyces proteolyticus]
MEPLFYRSAQAVTVTVLSFLSLILCIPPIIWHLTNRNLAASFLVAFVILSDLFNFINALIWPTDNINSWWDGSVLCDVEVKLFIAIQVGMPGALVCIFRNLALVMDTENAVLIPSWGQRLRRIAIDLLFCAVIPVIAMVTHFIVQGNRYYIFGISGCNISYDESWLTIALSAAWPPTICIIAAGYCILVVYRLIKYTSEFSSILRASGSNLTTKRFVRLFSLALVMILFVLPLQSYVFYTNVALMLPLQPYSWTIAHGPDFNTIIKVPSGGVVKPDRWIPIALSVLVFGFFGLGQDAMRMYRSSLSRIGLTRLNSSLSSHSSSETGKSGSSWYDSLMSKSGNGKWLKKKQRHVSPL